MYRRYGPLINNIIKFEKREVKVNRIITKIESVSKTGKFTRSFKRLWNFTYLNIRNNGTLKKYQYIEKRERVSIIIKRR